VEDLLFSIDEFKRTFLHLAAEQGSSETAKQIMAVLPRSLALRLSLYEDYLGRTPCDVETACAAMRGQPYSDDDILRKDYVDQAGSFSQEFYPLVSLPKVIIFYSTTNRLSGPSTDGKETDAAAEKDCVEKYFTHRAFPTIVIKDPTKNDIYSIISDVADNMQETCLLVFIMTHGMKGLVIVKGNVEGQCDYLTIEEIMKHMCRKTKGIPKVSYVVR
jgi:hypothetical protein